MDILSPAGSLESVKAAVMSGADAIYMGYGDFNARRNAKNFTEEEFIEAVTLCNHHNVKVLITMNIVLNDRELVPATDFIRFLAKQNISAVIVQDLGVLKLIKSIAPTIPVHASTQLTVHNLDGVLMAHKLGFNRVVLSRELSYENIAYICKNSPIEIEVFVHGALCMCYSGQCYLSSIIGSRSGNRGLCAQPCRLPYSYDDQKNKQPLLSLKDLSLINHISKLEKAGVACLKIEGRMKRPEYTAVVTKIYSTILAEKRMPTRDEIDTLERIFSRTGFTEGYFNAKVDSTMFGVKQEPNTSDLTVLHDKIAKEYANSSKTYPISMYFSAKSNIPTSLTAIDLTNGENITVEGDIPEIAINKPSTVEQITTSLAKTGGTIFTADDINVEIDDGLMVRASSINKLRREALEYLTNAKFKPKNYQTFDYIFDKKIKNSKKPIKYSVEVTKLTQISSSMYKVKPEILYIPLVEIVENQNEITKLLNLGFNLCIKLPKIVTDNQTAQVEEMLQTAKKLGINSILTANVGHIRDDFDVYGDFSLNIYNSIALKQVFDLGLKRQTLSFELKSSQIRDISKCMPTEIFGYGYLPLMIFENCAIKRKKNACVCKTEQVYLSDRKDEKFALLPEFGCRNTLLNSKPLYILDKMSDFDSIGIDVVRLYFSTETEKQCDEIYNAHINNTSLNLDFTRGLYYRGAL
ncbi:MAG: DUF3656 domain-containing protein [Clostridia bacterium]